MGIFRKIFGRKGNTRNPGAGPMPTRKLNLQYIAAPENGPLFARQFVDAVKNNEGIQLDYSVGTIAFVDKFLQRFSDEGLSVNDFAETIFVAGSYVGQVMINNNNGRWIPGIEVKLPEGVSMSPIVVKLQHGTVADPIAKAFKRFHFGSGDDLGYFYQVFTRD